MATYLDRLETLGALLAEQTARAERADAALSKAELERDEAEGSSILNRNALKAAHALLAEQTARAERAEAELTSIGFLIEADPSRDLVDEVREGVIAAEADAARAEMAEMAEAERDQALAACAEQTARAERAIKALAYAMVVEALGREPALLPHQANPRAERAEAACAEMRAAGDRLHDDLVIYHPRADVLAAWNTLRARPDLGASMVVMPREVVESARDACAMRRWDPDYEKVTADLDALLKKGGG